MQRNAMQSRRQLKINKFIYECTISNQKDFPSQVTSFYKGAKLITKGTVVTDHISDGLLVFLHHNPKDRDVRSVIKEEIGNPSII